MLVVMATITLFTMFMMMTAITLFTMLMVMATVAVFIMFMLMLCFAVEIHGRPCPCHGGFVFEMPFDKFRLPAHA